MEAFNLICFLFVLCHLLFLQAQIIDDLFSHNWLFAEMLKLRFSLGMLMQKAFPFFCLSFKPALELHENLLLGCNTQMRLFYRFIDATRNSIILGSTSQILCNFF